MQQLQQFYLDFLNIFPSFLHPFVSLGLAAILIVSVIQVLKKNFIFIVVLVILLPASVPILKGVVDALLGFIKFILRI